LSSQKLDLLKEEQFKGQINMISNNLHVIIIFWLPQRFTQNQQVSERLFKKNLWSILYPFLTVRGQENFHQNINSKYFLDF
jgi:hypothetical protein